MKNWLRGIALSAAGLAFACGGGSDDGGTECTTLVGNSVPVGGNAQCIDIGDFLSGTAECRSDGRFDTTTCTGGNSNGNTPVDTPEYGLCAVGGSECVSGTECAPIASSGGTTIGACGESCDPAGATTCPSGRVCENLDPTVSGGLCLDQTGERNDYCGLSLSAFVDPPIGIACTGDLECTTTINFGQECKDRCNPEDVGTTTNCGGSDTCLASGRLEFQEDTAGDPVSCITPGETTDCAAGYICRGFRDLTQGGGNFTVAADNICVRATGRCGAEAPLITDYTTPSIQALGDADFCGLPGQDVWCPSELVADSTATIECTPTGFVSVFENGGTAVSCNPANGGLDCPVELGADCVATSNGNVCGFALTVCTPFCEDAAGVTQLDCGTGFTCGAPTVDAGDYVDVVFQLDASNNIVTCPNGISDCDPDFACEDLFSDIPASCVRNRRVCVPD